MSKTLCALYPTQVDSENAVASLEKAGFSRDSISVITHRGSHLEAGVQVDELNASGGVGAGAVGGVVGGILATLGLAAIPGVGWVLAAGPLASIAAAGGIAGATGLVGGGIAGALTKNGVSKEHSGIYAEAVRRGGTLVALTVQEDEVDAATAQLGRHNPIDLDASAERWRSNGWAAYDANAPEYTCAQIEKERAYYARRLAGSLGKPVRAYEARS